MWRHGTCRCSGTGSQSSLLRRCLSLCQHPMLWWWLPFKLRISCISLRILLSMGLFWGDYEQCRWKCGEIRWEQCCSLSHSGASFLGQSHSQQWFWLEVWATQRKNEQMLADAFRTSTVFGSARVWTVEPLVECRSWCEMRKFAGPTLHSCDAGLKQRTSVFPP